MTRQPPRRIEPSPAAAYPATQSQRWRRRHYWGPILFAAAFTVITIWGLVRYLTGDHGSLGWVFSGIFALFLWVMAYLMDEVPRTKRLLRKSPWIEYPAATVSLTAWTKVGNVNVSFLDGDGVRHEYQLDPNDRDFQEGDRPIWFAGDPGKQWGVLSLREGACTGIGYTSWVGSRWGARGRAAAVPRAQDG